MNRVMTTPQTAPGPAGTRPPDLPPPTRSGAPAGSRAGTGARLPAPPRTRDCPHHPPCPPATAPDRDAARIIAAQPVQGWSLLCNGVISFEDTGELLPDGSVIPPHRPGTGT
jgi:hypothetical protein